jgi:cell division protein ZapA
MPAAQPKNVIADPLATSSKVSVSIHGRAYYVTCDANDEERLAQLVDYVEGRIDDIAAHNPGATETKLFMMTCLILADELIEAKRAAKEGSAAEEDLMVAAVDHLRSRIAYLAERVGTA